MAPRQRFAMELRAESGAESRPETLSRQAYAAIRREIREGRIAADRMYSEAQIAEMMGISRTPVREALIELSREGVIEKLPQRGFRLRRVSSLERREAFVVRELLEAYVVKCLAQQSTAGQVTAMRALLIEQAEAQPDASRFFEIDEELHLGMASALGFHRIREVLLSVRGINWVSGMAALTDPDRMRTTLQEHAEIVEAIAQHDPTRAKAAIHRHIRNSARSGDEGMQRL